MILQVLYSGSDVIASMASGNFFHFLRRIYIKFTLTFFENFFLKTLVKYLESGYSLTARRKEEKEGWKYEYR